MGLEVDIDGTQRLEGAYAGTGAVIEITASAPGARPEDAPVTLLSKAFNGDPETGVEHVRVRVISSSEQEGHIVPPASGPRPATAEDH